MKKNWILNNLYLICSVIWFLLAVLRYQDKSASALVWFCLGCLYLCLHLMKRNKLREEKRKEELNSK